MKKLITAALLTFALCGAASADQLADIKARKTLVCGVFGDLVPLGFEDPATRKPAGFDVDICAAIAASLGVQLQISTVSVAARIPAVSTGRVDIVAAALGYTADRAKQVDFSSAYYQTPIPLLVKKDGPYKSFADLKGKKVSAIRASTPELFARQALKDTEVMTFDDGPAAYLALQQNKVQAMAISQGAGIGFRNRSQGGVVFMDEVLHWEPECIGVKKGETALLDAVNQALDELETSGKLQAIWDKWFGPDTEYKLQRERKVTPLAQIQSQ